MPHIVKVLHFGYGKEVYFTEVEELTIEELQEKWEENRAEVSKALARLPGIVVPLALVADRSETHVA